MKIKNIGIIGAGQMGNGIAHICALAGYEVLIMDISPDLAQKALATISKNLARQVKAEKISESDSKAALARIKIADDFNNSDLVIEAAAEDENIKRAIFFDLCPKLKPDAILCTNTSSLSITHLAEATDRPQNFIGLHFMNPPPVMELVELIRGSKTSDETFRTVQEFALSLGKTIAVSADTPAFILNRILIPMINEAIFALYEGVGDITSIDTAMRLGARHPMGPLELADYIGLDTCLAAMKTIHEGMGQEKYRPCPLLEKHVSEGHLGRKTGRGFYDYSGDEPIPAG